jgi:hypothetical protein
MTRRATFIDDPPKSNTKHFEDPPKSIEELREEAIGGFLQIGQFICLAFGDYSDAGAIGIHGPGFISESVKLANENKAIADKLDLFVKVGPYAGFIGVLIPFGLQIAVNHGVFKPEQFANAGIVSPQSLEYEMKATIAKQQMEALQRQRDAEDNLRTMSEQMAAAMNGDADRESAANNGE